jgi:hypothetical protein
MSAVEILRFSQCRCRFRASGMLYCIEIQIAADVLENVAPPYQLI